MSDGSGRTWHNYYSVLEDDDESDGPVTRWHNYSSVVKDNDKSDMPLSENKSQGSVDKTKSQSVHEPSSVSTKISPPPQPLAQAVQSSEDQLVLTLIRMGHVDPHLANLVDRSVITVSARQCNEWIEHGIEHDQLIAVEWLWTRFAHQLTDIERGVLVVKALGKFYMFNNASRGVLLHMLTVGGPKQMNLIAAIHAYAIRNDHLGYMRITNDLVLLQTLIDHCDSDDPTVLYHFGDKVLWVGSTWNKNEAEFTARLQLFRHVLQRFKRSFSLYQVERHCNWGNRPASAVAIRFLNVAHYIVEKARPEFLLPLFEAGLELNHHHADNGQSLSCTLGFFRNNRIALFWLSTACMQFATVHLMTLKYGDTLMLLPDMWRLVLQFMFGTFETVACTCLT